MENNYGDLTYADRVGTGFSEADLTEIRRQLGKQDFPGRRRLPHPKQEPPPSHLAPPPPYPAVRHSRDCVDHAPDSEPPRR